MSRRLAIVSAGIALLVVSAPRPSLAAAADSGAVRLPVRPEPVTGITPGRRPPPNYSAAPGSRDWPIDAVLTRISPAGDRAWRRSAAEGHAYGDSLLGVAHANGDRLLAAAVHVWRGRKYANDSRIDEGKADLDTAWALSLALRDSAGLARTLVARGHGAQVAARNEEAAGHFARLLPLARAAGLPGLVGFGHRGLGMVDKLAGRYESARRNLNEAIRLLPANRFENMHSRFLLAEVKNRTGQHDEARRDFLALIDEGRRTLQPWMVAACFNDLGILEYGEGDMALADRYWAFSAQVFDSTGYASSAMASNTNRAHALIHLGHHEEARRLLEQLLAEAVKLDDPGARNAALTELGSLSFRVGRHAEAERHLRAVRAAEKEDFNEYHAASSILAELLRGTGRGAESLALLDSLLAPDLLRRTMPDALADVRMQRARTLRALGRPDEALGDARAAERAAATGRSKGSIYWLDAAMELGRCHLARGAADSAVAILARAARHWERWRAEISDLQWRERQGSGMSTLFAEYGLALLDARRSAPPARRAREAFDAMQAFQARTLEERMHGRGLSGRGMLGRVGADSLRRGLLREGELLVDLVATPDTTIAFLLTRTRMEVRLLPGTKQLERLHDTWREATLNRADEATVRAGLARLSAEVVGPIAPAFAGVRRLIVTGGGPLALWPWAALTVPGEDAPLCETREIYMAPSATIFAALRARGPAPAAGRMLAVGRTTDAAGRDLPGAERELQTLASQYGGEARVNRGDRAVADLAGDLSRWGVLHFAAHAESEAGTPWRSGFLLGAGTSDEAYLRASGIAGMKLRADLAVLSGCQSAGATTLAGEGALGLASAFLCSGTRSVVATLWPVADRVAERFMTEFYAALARGRTVAGAVSEAQRALRGRSETANPRDWAAFVASGEGATKVRLPRRGAIAGEGR